MSRQLQVTMLQGLSYSRSKGTQSDGQSISAPIILNYQPTGTMSFDQSVTTLDIKNQNILDCESMTRHALKQ